MNQKKSFPIIVPFQNALMSAHRDIQEAQKNFDELFEAVRESSGAPQGWVIEDMSVGFVEGSKKT